MITNNELLQQLQQPELQAELQEYIEVGWWAYVRDLKTGEYRLLGIVSYADSDDYKVNGEYYKRHVREECLVFVPSTDWLWKELIEVDVIAYTCSNGIQVTIDNPYCPRNKSCDILPEKEFTAPTLHEALLSAWLWWRANVKEAE